MSRVRIRKANEVLFTSSLEMVCHWGDQVS